MTHFKINPLNVGNHNSRIPIFLPLPVTPGTWSSTAPNAGTHKPRRPCPALLNTTGDLPKFPALCGTSSKLLPSPLPLLSIAAPKLREGNLLAHMILEGLVCSAHLQLLQFSPSLCKSCFQLGECSPDRLIHRTWYLMML